MATPPLLAAIDEFLDWMDLDKHRSPRTITEYRADLQGFAAFASGHPGAADVEGLDRDLLRAYQRHVAEAVPKNRNGEPIRGRKHLAPATRKRRLVALKSLLDYLAREEWTKGTLSVHVDLPKLDDLLPSPIQEKTREQLDKALPTETLLQLRNRALIMFLLSSGCRLSEALGLDRSGWQRDQVVVMGKGSKQRVVIVTAKARAAVDAYLEARGADLSPALFVGFQPQKMRERLSAAGASHVCHQVARRLGQERWHPHQLRHTFGSAVQDEMGDTRLTAELLGHSGLGSVAGYTKISRRRRDDVAAALQEKGY
ncbi:MAG: tyrosine-type recombinase/integrase [Candidatus Dormibacteria bacterium]